MLCTERFYIELSMGCFGIWYIVEGFVDIKNGRKEKKCKI